MALNELPDELILIITENISGPYYNWIDKQNLTCFYSVSKQFYKLSNYYVTRHLNNEVNCYPPKSLCYKCHYTINNDKLINYNIWHLKGRIKLRIAVSVIRTRVYNKNYINDDNRKAEAILKALYNAFPTHMKVITKPISLSAYPFPLFDTFIYSYLGI